MKYTFIEGLFYIILVEFTTFAWIVMGTFLAPLISKTASFFHLVFYCFGVASGSILINLIAFKNLEIIK